LPQEEDARARQQASREDEGNILKKNILFLQLLIAET